MADLVRWIHSDTGRAVLAVGELVTATAALAALVIAILEIRQSQRAFALQQRSWVTVLRAELVNGVVPDVAPTGILRFKNVGTGPAIDAQVRLRMTWASGTADRLEPPTNEVQRVSIGPDVAAQTQVTSTHPATPEFMEGLAAKTLFLYMHGSIRYTDPVGTEGETTYCFVWTGRDMATCAGGRNQMR